MSGPLPCSIEAVAATTGSNGCRSTTHDAYIDNRAHGKRRGLLAIAIEPADAVRVGRDFDRLELSCVTTTAMVLKDIRGT